MPLSIAEKQNRAIRAAIARAHTLPIVDGKMEIWTTVQYWQRTSEDTGKWSDTHACDPWGRALINVKARFMDKEVEIDSFRIRDADDELSPVSVDAPVWWRQ